MKIRNILRLGAVAAIIAAAGAGISGCDKSAQRAEALQSAAELADSLAGEGWAIAVEAEGIAATYTLTDSLIDPAKIGDALFDVYAAQQLKSYPAAHINTVCDALRDNGGMLEIKIVSPAKNTEREIGLTARRIITLQKSKNSQLNASAAREQTVKMAETMIPAPGAHKAAVRTEASVVKSFLEYNIIFADDKEYAGKDQSLLTVRYFEPLKAQYRALGDLGPALLQMLEGMGIDGVRIVYSAENSDKTIKQAFPWREITK